LKWGGRGSNPRPTDYELFVVLAVSFDPFGHRTRESLQHDQRRCPRRMCCREQRRCRERAADRDEDRFAAPEIIEHRGNAVGPLL
jgi:hypothetical protein